MKIISYGEIMLRLQPPTYHLLEQTNQLTFSFVGTGVNLLSSLYRFGHEVAIVSQVPNNQLGKAAMAEMRKLGIKDNHIGKSGDHMGSYFVELGFGNRPSIVTYQNRLASSFCTSGKEAYDFDKIVSWADIVHICGITISLTKETRQSGLTLARKAKEKGKIICFDFNFRPSLNKDNDINELKKHYEELLFLSDIVFGTQNDLTNLLGFKLSDFVREEDQLLNISKQFMNKYNIKNFCGTIRRRDEILGFIVEDKLYLSPMTKIHTLDRIGSGDAFAAVIINGYAKSWEKEKTLKIAMANSQLAHATLGDVALFTEEQLQFFIDNPNLDLLR